jgi:hypothetical protein
LRQSELLRALRNVVMMMMVVAPVVIPGKCRHGCAEQQNACQYCDYALLHSYVPPANAPWSVHSVSSTLTAFFLWAKVYFVDPCGQPTRWPDGAFNPQFPPQTVYT